MPSFFRLPASFVLILALVFASASPAAAQPTPERLNHFVCYESQQGPLGRPGVLLEDRFDTNGPSTVTVQQAKRLCAPADVNDYDPTAPNDAAHLTAYTVRQTAPHFERRNSVQFNPDNPLLGRLFVDLVRPDRLLVPTAKNVGSQVPSPLVAPIDHYKCYRVKGGRQRLRGVGVRTQFGSLTVDIKRPLRFCTPVDTNGQGITDPVRALMCYQVHAVSQAPMQVSTHNPFEQATFDVSRVRELCVPAYKETSCGDGVTDPPEHCDPPGASAQCTSGTCKGDCRCAASVCGNGLIEGTEGCDGGRCANGSECDSNCTCPPDCQQGACGYGGECAPDGSCTQCGCQATIEGGSTCSASCFAASCGSSADCGPGNVCAAGGTQCCDACDYDCSSLNDHCPLPSCGDGVVNHPREQCDGADDAICPGFCLPDCTCLRFPAPCGYSGELGQCGGACPAGSVCSFPLSGANGISCSCVPGSVPCVGFNDPEFPTCGGDCGEGQTCYALVSDFPPGGNVCGCAATTDAPCVTGEGACGGGTACPAGQVCNISIGTGVCRCE